VLIDCGHAANFQGVPWYPGHHLQHWGIDFIDLLVFTNYDEDHASGFADFRSCGINVGCILGNPSVAPKTIVTLKSEDGMGNGIRAVAETLAARRLHGIVETPPNIPGLFLTWAWNPYPKFEDENNLSLVTNLRIHGWNFIFPGDMELQGWQHLLSTCPPFRDIAANAHVLVAAHHGRNNGICPELFDVYGCSPRLVVISDDYKQYETQETTSYYASKAMGIGWFRDGGARKVLTTRSDHEIRFTFQNGGVLVW
jgi:beta-lactamase superfamily II metal-dependent hydrolase